MFRSKITSGTDLIISTVNLFYSLPESCTVDTQTPDELAKALAVIKTLLQGGDGAESPSSNADVVNSVLSEIYRGDFMGLLAHRLTSLDWDVRKNVVHIWYSLLQPLSIHSSKGVNYILRHPEVISDLIKSYDVSNAAVNAGSMLRETIKHPSLAKTLLENPDYARLFMYVEETSFDVASDAFMTLKDSLRKYPTVASSYLANNFEFFFGLYEKLITSKNYVTRRQSVKLLGEVLLDRANVNIMLRFINDSHNLRIIMSLLSDESRNIQFEAFHVFKVFVANPSKSEGIMKLLCRNKERLVDYLQNFHTDREDEEFQEEKELLMEEIESLPS